MALTSFRLLLQVSESGAIMRRYFVVNGFDGALTLLGLLMGFHISDAPDLQMVITSCLATTLALGVSGISSAYISEAAERRSSLAELERAMVSDLKESHHARAAFWIPWLVALTNGSAPFLIGMVIIIPLWLAHNGLSMPVDPLLAAMGTALVVIFSLGVFLGRIGGVFWLWSGLQALAIAMATLGLIHLLG